LLAVPVVCPVSCGAVAFAGRPRAGETLTVALRADTLARSVETPAKAPIQLNEAVFC